MNARNPKFSCLSLLVLLVLTCSLRAGKTPADIPDRWVRVSFIGCEIVGMKKEIPIDAEKASKLFTKDHNRAHLDWEKDLGVKIEDAPTSPNSRTIPDTAHVWRKSTDQSPRATVLEFSKRELVVAIVVLRGNLLWQQFYDCKVRVRMPRNKEIDALFDVASLEKTFGAEYKGLKQGDTVGDITKKLGPPDGTGHFQAGNYYELYYFKDNIVFLINGPGDGGWIQQLEFGVPERFKDEIKKHGPHITR